MTPSHPAEHLLERLRDQVRWVVVVAYLLYFVFWWANTGFSGAQVMLDPHGWLAGVALLSGLSLGMPPGTVWRSHLVQQVLMLAVVGMTLVYAQRNLKSAPDQYELWQWLAVIMVILPISFGAVTGLTLGGIMLLALFAMMVASDPFGMVQDKLYVSGFVTAAFAAVFGYLIMGFIERNLMLHEQTSSQLAAARKDALTGALGRAAIEEELRRAVLHARRTGTPLSLIVTDIDFFKRVNDEFGHGAGDDVLRSFAKRLRRNVGSSGGIVGRWGGEEFLVALPGLARPEALAMAEHLRYEVSSHAVAGQSITASFGVASFRRSGDDMESMFARADERLYEAKNAGRNKVRG